MRFLKFFAILLSSAANKLYKIHLPGHNNWGRIIGSSLIVVQNCSNRLSFSARSIKLYNYWTRWNTRKKNVQRKETCPKYEMREIHPRGNAMVTQLRNQTKRYRFHGLGEQKEEGGKDSNSTRLLLPRWTILPKRDPRRGQWRVREEERSRSCRHLSLSCFLLARGSPLPDVIFFLFHLLLCSFSPCFLSPS